MSARRGGAALRRSRTFVCVAFAATLLGSAENERSPATLGTEQLYALAPHLAQIVNLAQLDPALAAQLVPETWVDALAAGVLAVDAEEPARAEERDPPRSWPIGPWTSRAALVRSIDALDPRAVASLYRALRPRFAAHCKHRGTSLGDCERAMRRTMARLGDASVHARTQGATSAPVTVTQRELARLGEPVVRSVRRRLRELDRMLFGRARGTRG